MRSLWFLLGSACPLLMLAAEAGHAAAQPLPTTGGQDCPLWHVVVIPDVAGLNAIPFSVEATREILPRREFPSSIYLHWSGQPEPKTRRPLVTISCTVTACTNTTGADRLVQYAVRGTPGVLRDISGDSRVSGFSDRAFALPGRLVFVRGTTYVDVSIAGDVGIRDEKVFTLAAAIGARIDAVAAGKPLPTQPIPLAADQDLHVDLPKAWELGHLQDVWGKDATTIVINDRQGLPRAIPAKAVDGHYLVPLRHMLTFLDPTARLESDLHPRRGPQQDATVTINGVTLNGVTLQFVNGSAEITKNGMRLVLPERVEFAGNEAIVPLSFVERALGMKVQLGKYGKLTKLMLLPKGK